MEKTRDIEPCVAAITQMLKGLMDSALYFTFGTWEKGMYTLDHYIRNMIRVMDLSTNAVVCAGILVNRFITRYPAARLGPGGVHRLALTSLMLATKSLDDIPYANCVWAQSSTFFTLSELNACEIELLGLLHYELHIDAAEYDATLGWLRGAYAEYYADESPITLATSCGQELATADFAYDPESVYRIELTSPRVQ